MFDSSFWKIPHLQWPPNSIFDGLLKFNSPFEVNERVEYIRPAALKSSGVLSCPYSDSKAEWRASIAPSSLIAPTGSM